MSNCSRVFRAMSTSVVKFCCEKSHRKKRWPEVVLWKRCCKIHRKTPVPEPLFNKVADLRPATLLKRDPGTGVFLLILPNFKEHLFLQNTSSSCFCHHLKPPSQMFDEILDTTLLSQNGSSFTSFEWNYRFYDLHCTANVF